ncbi:MAG: hypothetical protein J7497_01645, partial [Chitinophagaceae bacterium]|nr:hypothetical protein [Chitinophagaceae bacterium]
AIYAIPYLLTYSFTSGIGAPRRYYDQNISDAIKIAYNRNTAIIVTFVILFATQLLYIVNLLIGLIKKENQDGVYLRP